jgi:hypothetical protein
MPYITVGRVRRGYQQICPIRFLSADRSSLPVDPMIPSAPGAIRTRGDEKFLNQVTP